MKKEEKGCSWNATLVLILTFSLICYYEECRIQRECKLTGKGCLPAGWNEVFELFKQIDHEFVIYYEHLAQMHLDDEHVQGNLTEIYNRLGHKKCCLVPGSCSPIRHYPFANEQAPSTAADPDLAGSGLFSARPDPVYPPTE